MIFSAIKPNFDQISILGGHPKCVGDFLFVRPLQKWTAHQNGPQKKTSILLGFFFLACPFVKGMKVPVAQEEMVKVLFVHSHEDWWIFFHFETIGNTFILIQIMDFPAKTSCEWVNSGLVSFSTFSPPHPVLQHPANSTQSTVPTPGHLSRDEHPTKNGYTPRKLTWNLKINGCKMTFPFWGRISYFQGRTVSFREGN